jgi:hypothetical protein
MLPVAVEQVVLGQVLLSITLVVPAVRVLHHLLVELLLIMQGAAAVPHFGPTEPIPEYPEVLALAASGAAALVVRTPLQ